MLIHANIPKPIQCWLDAKFFYDLELFSVPLSKLYHRVEVHAVSSYKGSVLTFSVRDLESGGTFHDIPPTALITYYPEQEEECIKANDPYYFATKITVLDYDYETGALLKKLVYHDCPEDEFALHVFDNYKDKIAWLFCRATEGIVSEPLRGKYHFSIDWHTGNNLVHIVEAENRLFVYPPHKILFKNEDEEEPTELPKWKKLHHEFSVEESNA